MYHHVKRLMYAVHVGEANPSFGRMLLEQFGGANGELAAAKHYTVQGINCEEPAIEDLLMDIGTEELSHLEVIGTLARLHLKPTKQKCAAAEAGPWRPLPAEAASTCTTPRATYATKPARDSWKVE
jgi:Mn-containing catalase